jgi:hypothetical protein
MKNRKLKIEKLEVKRLMTADVCFPAEPPEQCGNPTWHNVIRPTDVNNSGETTVFDALLIINELEIKKYEDPDNEPFLIDAALADPHPDLYYDVNNNDKTTALDALLVLNHIAIIQDGEGEIAMESSIQEFKKTEKKDEYFSEIGSIF